MPGSTALQGFPYSLGSDNPNTIDTTMQALAEAAEKRVVQVYFDVADRDSKLTAPGQGSMVFLVNPASLLIYAANGWKTLYPQPVITSSASVPSNTTGKDGDIHLVI